ncbi:hypothetical protein ATE84_5203 [Aquimarina sp. MAR_2010_214]|uniref:hypothetical protein n=1 Tax=Aquimarina sp. MAR_2010_214 TaxID=1250026 RepID=UPI000C715A23|nr:hypothetical protein [Aquimarina sp. MAR_2010_214]PKV53069.1 hypothetical protein ATE84_5203 [Aquimarina sp. MAR_2010_214]
MNRLFPIPAFTIAGLIMTFISIMITIPDYEGKEILKTGKLVDVLIEKAPDHCKKRHKRDILVVFFNYKGKTHSRNVNEKWCKEIKNEQVLQMKSNDSGTDFVFTWETEGELSNEIGSGIILTLFGLFLIFKGYYDRRKNKTYEQHQV